MRRLKTVDLHQFSEDLSMSKTPAWARFWKCYGTWPRPITEFHICALGKPDLYANLGSERRRFGVWEVRPGVAVMVNDVKGVCVNSVPGAEVDQALTDYVNQLESMAVPMTPDGERVRVTDLFTDLDGKTWEVRDFCDSKPVCRYYDPDYGTDGRFYYRVFDRSAFELEVGGRTVMTRTVL